MTTPTAPELSALLRQASHARERLVLAVGPSGSGKTTWLRSLSEAHDLTYLSLGSSLARALVELSPRQRPLAVLRTIDALLPASGTGVCLDNTDLLFASELRCAPLRLVAQLSQHRLIVAAFTGTLVGRRFARAYPDHPEYLSTELSGLSVASLSAGIPSFYQT